MAKRGVGISRPRVDLLRLEQIASEAKRANQRLRELEKKGMAEESRAYQELRGMFFSADLIEGTDIFSKTKTGEMKFRTDIRRVAKESPEKLKLLETRLSQFLSAPTSTVKGIRAERERIKKIKDNFKKKFGEDFTDEQIRRMLRDINLFNRLSKYLDSGETLKVMADIDEGYLNEKDVLEYLDRVDAGEFGFTLHEMYSYHSTTTDEEWEAPW